MNLTQKLKLSGRANVISLIDEGLFLRAYNQSAYGLVKLLGLSFKLNCLEINKYNHIKLIYCGLPKAAVFKRFPDVVKTTWGFELSGNYDYADYLMWFTTVWAQNGKSCTDVKVISDMSPRGEATNVATTRVADQRVYLPLNMRQQIFLTRWQKGIYSTDNEQQFIENLANDFKALLSIGINNKSD